MSIPTTNAAAMREFSRAALCDALRHAGASDEVLQRLRRGFAELDDVQGQVLDVLGASSAGEEAFAAEAPLCSSTSADDPVYDAVMLKYQAELDQLSSMVAGTKGALREQVRDIMAGLGADGAVEAMSCVLRAYVDLYGREGGLKPP